MYVDFHVQGPFACPVVSPGEYWRKQTLRLKFKNTWPISLYFSVSILTFFLLKTRRMLWMGSKMSTLHSPYYHVLVTSIQWFDIHTCSNIFFISVVAKHDWQYFIQQSKAINLFFNFPLLFIFAAQCSFSKFLKWMDSNVSCRNSAIGKIALIRC